MFFQQMYDVFKIVTVLVLIRILVSYQNVWLTQN